MKQFLLIIKKIFSSPLDILFLRIVGYHKPYRVAFLRLLTIVFKRFRPHFHSALYEIALEAKELNITEISVIEFGVAGGNGLLSIEKYCKKISKKLSVKFKIYGFDLGDGKGLPISNDSNDINYFWSSGDFKMNENKLRKKIKSSELILGDIKKTLPIFLENKNIPPIGAIFFDLDFYSSTKESFRIFEINQNFRLPRIKCYFDDIQPPSNNFNSIFKAINEFNVSQKNKKIVKPSGSTLDYKYGPWNEEFYEFHDFKHDKYNNKIFKTIILTEL